MIQKELINIGRDLILKAGLLKKPNEAQKKKFLALLDKYELKLSDASNKYTSIILGFIADIRGDIHAGRDINIDSIKDDEYIENYFITKHEVDTFNSLIDSESYSLIFDELQKKKYSKTKVDSAIKKIDTNFQAHFKKLSRKNISKNLLIFTMFERKLPIPALNRLIQFMQQHESLGNDVIVIDRLERIYREFLREFYKDCIVCLQSKKINYKFLKYEQDSKSGKLSMAMKTQDASKYGLRSGNPAFEYKELLKKMS